VLIDTHCHLGDDAYRDDLAEVLQRAGQAGVGRVVVIGESREAADRALTLSGSNPMLSATAGVHPHVATTWSDQSALWLAERLQQPSVVAAGEMGLDYHYDHSPRDTQRAAFEEQLGLAGRAGKPAVIHAREADADVAAILRNHPGTTAILHSWSSGEELLHAGLELGHYFSFSGMVTFRNWSGQAALARIPRDRLLVETDGPYLAPVPHRGKRNEPAFVVMVAQRIAELLGISFDEVQRVTTENAVRVFGMTEVV
jgi:TatD DNase family protein